MIPLSAPELRGNEWKYLQECLDTGWVSSAGPFVGRFESACAAAIGRSHAVAVASGTAALHLALLVAGVRPGDDVLVSDLTFIAPVNAIRYVGATPVLVDAEPAYWQIDTGLVCEYLRRGPGRVRAILPVDVLGTTPDIRALTQLGRQFNIPVIEDASEALGSDAGKLTDIACFSFNGNKVITTGGGGLIVTDRPEWAEHARHLSTQAREDPVEGKHDEIGYNYRLSNTAAAIGCAQLEMLDEFIRAKREHAARYAAELAGIPGLTLMPGTPESTYWLYTVLIDENAFGISRTALQQNLARAGIESRPLWQPMHLSKPHRGCRVLGGGVAERLHRDGLSLPSSVGLKPAQLQRVATVIRESCR